MTWTQDLGMFSLVAFMRASILGMWPRGGTWNGNGDWEWTTILSLTWSARDFWAVKRHMQAVVTVSNSSPYASKFRSISKAKIKAGKHWLEYAHIGTGRLHKLTKFLQQSNEELFGFTQHPSGLGNEQPQEDSAHNHLPLYLWIHHCKVLWQLHTRQEVGGASMGVVSTIYYNNYLPKNFWIILLLEEKTTSTIITVLVILLLLLFLLLSFVVVVVVIWWYV